MTVADAVPGRHRPHQRADRRRRGQRPVRRHRRGSGTGARFGGAEANIEAFTETQWLTVRPEIAPYPF